MCNEELKKKMFLLVLETKLLMVFFKEPGEKI